MHLSSDGKLFQALGPMTCNLFDSVPILIIFGRNVAKGHYNVKMLTYLMLSFLSSWVQHQLKCCNGSKQRLIDTWSGMQQSVVVLSMKQLTNE